jgi:hypothetical protein
MLIDGPRIPGPVNAIVGLGFQESVRQMRGTARAQIPGARISICHGVGGMFAASGTIIMSNEPP